MFFARCTINGASFWWNVWRSWTGFHWMLAMYICIVWCYGRCWHQHASVQGNFLDFFHELHVWCSRSYSSMSWCYVIRNVYWACQFHIGYSESSNFIWWISLLLGTIGFVTIYIYIYIYIYTYIEFQVVIDLFIFTYIYIYMYMYMYVYIYVCVYLYRWWYPGFARINPIESHFKCSMKSNQPHKFISISIFMPVLLYMEHLKRSST